MLKLPPVVLRLLPILASLFLLHLCACSPEPTADPIDEFALYETAGYGEGGAPPQPLEETGTEETELEETGAAETGAAETGAAETGAAETGAEETGAEETGAEETGEEPTADLKNNASIVDNNLPLSLLCNALTPVNIVVRNTGTTTWTKADGYKLGTVDDEDPLYPSGTRVWLSEEAEVPPNAEWTFEFDLQAPAQSGVFFSDWRMVLEGEEWFGEIASRDIAVDCPQGGDPAPTEYTANDENEVFASAVKIKQEHPEFFDIEDLDNFTKRSLAYEMMTLVINDLRSKGVNASRCVANPGLPESDPFLWCSDALVVGSPGFGTTIDIYYSWSYPGDPQTSVTEEGGQTGVVTSDLIPLP